MTSLRRSAIKARRSFNRIFKSTRTREGPTSAWPDSKEIGQKLLTAAERAWKAEVRLHSSGMPKNRAQALRGKPRFTHTRIPHPTDHIILSTATFVSKAHERAKAKQTKAAAKQFKRFVRKNPQNIGGTMYSRKWKKDHGYE